MHFSTFRRNRAARVIALTLVIVSWVCFGREVKQPRSARIALTSDGRKWAEETLKSLSLEEKVGQMLQLRYYGDYKSIDSDEYRRLRDEIQKYHIGSVVMGMHFNASGPIRSSALSSATIANQMQRDSKLPLLLAADLERGVASRLNDAPSFPWPMAFGAAADLKEVERFAGVTAREARAVGIHWALAPVADVNNNPANPIINTRSFGEDPGQVGDMVAAFIRGAHEQGMVVTAKHFPGHGDSVIDSHRGIAMVGGDLTHLETIEFPPFKKAIAAGVDSILLAHARVPALDSDPNRIATLSPKIVTDVLKGQLGFQGLVVTDALEMRGIMALYGPQEANPSGRAAVDAVIAGDDVIMLPSEMEGTFHGIVEAVRSGQIKESRIDDSVRKILQMKASLGLNETRFVDVEQAAALVSKPEDMAFAQHMADEAITLVRDNGEVLPLRRLEAPARQRIAVIVIPEVLASSSGRELEKAFRARRPDASIFFVDNRATGAMSSEILKAVSEAEKVVVVAFVVHSATRQVMVAGSLVSSYGLAGPVGQLLHDVLASAEKKTVVVAMGSPYLIEDFQQIRTYLCTYATATTSEVSTVKALFGELQNHGKLPVTLPGVALRGFSLPLPGEAGGRLDRH